MKKLLVKCLFLIILFLLPVSPVFSEGSSETQRLFLQNFPFILNQQDRIQTTAGSSSSLAEIEKDMAFLTRLYKYLEQNFLWEIDHEKAYEAMATALFESLGDKYTYYVTSENSEDYLEETMGQYGGLGFYFSKTLPDYQDNDKPETLYCNINQVFPNSPASKSGILAGDLITHIDSISVVTLSAQECASKMKGEIGTKVSITVLRNGIVFDLTLTREQINTPSVVSSFLENNIGYLQILQFYSQTTSALLEELKALESQGMKALIIDLRNCPGGDVDAALSIADLFISGSELLTVNYKNSARNKTYVANKGIAISEKIPIAVLINENTASSAEILASTLKDNKRAVLIGTKTYGKGIMQTVSSFGSGEISVTVASFVPPSGNEIHQKGVEPDIVVPSVAIKEEDAQAYLDLMSNPEISEFIDEHKEYTKENVLLFTQTHPDTGLSDEIVNLVVRNKYLSKMTYEQQPKVDTFFDPQVIAAVDYLCSLSD